MKSLTLILLILGSISAQSKSNIKKIYTFRGHKDHIRALAFSPDGKYLASSGDRNDQSIKIWDIQSKKLYTTLKGQPSAVNSIAFSPDGRHLISGGGDNNKKDRNNFIVKLWDMKKMQLVRNYYGHSDSVYSVTFSPDGKIIASGSTNGVLILWNRKDGKIIRKITDSYYSINSIVFTPNGKYLVSAGTAMIVFHVKTGKKITTFPMRVIRGESDSHNEVNVLSVSPDGRFFALGNRHNSIDIVYFDSKKGKFHSIKVIRADFGGVLAVAISPNSRFVAGGGFDRILRIWDVKTRKLIKESVPLKNTNDPAGIGFKNTINTISFSPDGNYIATGDQFWNVILWDVSFLLKK